VCINPGVEKLTAVIIIAETNGFELILNKKQLTSYAGLDIKEKQSGTSVEGKPKISKLSKRE
jgi:transposase